MEHSDRVLRCADCGAEFIFTVGEQRFYAEKGFKNEPKRCKSCKAKASCIEGMESWKRPVPFREPAR